MDKLCSKYTWIKRANVFYTVKEDINFNDQKLSLYLHINDTAFWEGEVSSYSGFILEKYHRTQKTSEEYGINQSDFDLFMKELIILNSDVKFNKAYPQLILSSNKYELFPYRYHLK